MRFSANTTWRLLAGIAALALAESSSFGHEARQPRVNAVTYLVTPMQQSGEQSTPGWALDRIDTRQRVRDWTYHYPGTGKGVNVYVVDSGVVPHADFGQRLVASYDAVPNDTTSPFQDPTGHGTSVAGIIGSSRYGVAKEVTLHAVSVVRWKQETWDAYADPLYSTEVTVAALDWIARNHQKPAVVNISQNSAPSKALDDAVRGLIAAGVMVVVSAGNGSDEMTTSPYVNEALTVGAIDGLDRRLPNTAHGPILDLFAPGLAVDTTSAWGGYTAFSYTSAAAPMVTGAVALYLEKHPTATPAQIHAWIVNTASTGLVTNINVSSTPNRLLYVPPALP